MPYESCAGGEAWERLPGRLGRPGYDDGAEATTPSVRSRRWLTDGRKENAGGPPAGRG